MSYRQFALLLAAASAAFGIARMWLGVGTRLEVVVLAAIGFVMPFCFVLLAWIATMPEDVIGVAKEVIQRVEYWLSRKR